MKTYLLGGYITLAAGLCVAPSEAGLTVLHTFCGSGYYCTTLGAEPGPLASDSSGNLYGVTQQEGNTSSSDNGKVYEIVKSGSLYTYQELYAFCASGGSSCSDGQNPVGKLVIDTGGSLYGVTQAGGAYGYGTIFKLSAPTGGGTPWTLTTLHNFCGSTSCGDGGAPIAGLTYVGASTGAYGGSAPLYGTNTQGGANGYGVAYKLASPNSSPSLTTLYNFCSASGCADGYVPQELIANSSGTLYGTARWGGYYSPTCTDDSGTVVGCGVAYSLAPDGSGGFTESTLYTFCNGASVSCTDAFFPHGPLVIDGSSNLLGTASGGLYTKGAIFKLTPSGSGYSEAVPFSFCASGLPCVQGAGPRGGLWLNADGSYYGTTCCGGQNGSFGTIFKLSGSLNLRLYSFCPGGSPCADGSGAVNGVIVDSSGNLFGTNWGYGGKVFEFTP